MQLITLAGCSPSHRLSVENQVISISEDPDCSRAKSHREAAAHILSYSRNVEFAVLSHLQKQLPSTC